MQPEITLNLGGTVYTVPAYNSLAALGAASALALALLLMKQRGLRHGLWLVVAMIPAFLVGARLWNYAVDAHAYTGDFHLWTLAFKGFSFYGGLLGACMVVVLFVRLSRQDPWRVLDALVVPAAVAFAIARTGCFMAGCCTGKLTFSALGMKFPDTAQVEAAVGMVSPLLGSIRPGRYPTQLYELGLALLFLLPVLPLLRRKDLPPGTAFLVYGVLFCLMRVVVLPLRDLPYSPVITDVVYPALYIGLMLAGVVLLRKRHTTAERQPDPCEECGP